jgi:hypothetical protein
LFALLAWELVNARIEGLFAVDLLLSSSISCRLHPPELIDKKMPPVPEGSGGQAMKADKPS